ncbi:MAG: DUF4013 domain-containing protein [Candidatus Gastranaerophilales bacterium]|nr:DUF4013 domain-containing protein [Candidatus Gastranaerophilales bacterium]
MSIDINKAINLPLSDPKWIQKLLIGGLFYFVFQVINSTISIFDYLMAKNQSFFQIPVASLFSVITFKLIALILALLFTSIPIGYVLQSVHNQVNDKDGFLPEWSSNLYFYFINGLKYIFIKFIYSIILFFLLLIPAISGFTVFKLNIDNPLISFSGVGLFTLIAVIIILGYLVIIPLIFISFAENFVISDAFDLKKLYKILFNNINDFILCDLFVLAAFTIQILLSILLVCTCVGILFIPFLYLPFFLIVMNLFSQAYLNARSSV